MNILRDICYTKYPILAYPPPSPDGSLKTQWVDIGGNRDLKINILALIKRDPQEDSTTLYKEHIWIHI